MNFNENSRVELTTNHTGKMYGLTSISTSNQKNPLCIKRKACDKIVCSKCYADAMENQYSDLNKKLSRNYDTLTTEIIPLTELPIINTLFHRFESFGDLANVIQAINYLHIAMVNPYVHCAIWTKNPWLLQKAVDIVGKPENLKVVYSINETDIPEENLQRTIRVMKRLYPCIDCVFAVYSAKYVKENGIITNCAGVSCFMCNQCYTGNYTEIYNGVGIQRELLRETNNPVVSVVSIATATKNGNRNMMKITTCVITHKNGETETITAENPDFTKTRNNAMNSYRNYCKKNGIAGKTTKTEKPGMVITERTV